MAAARSDAHVDPVPLLVWLVLQLAALALAAFRVPLAAQYPEPVEFQAVRLMLAVQFAALAMLHPWLLRTWATAVAVLASAWVMLWIAALLSAWALTDADQVGAFVSLWILAFALLSRIRRLPWQLATVAISTAYFIGGPLLWYLRLEFASAPDSEPSLRFGPLLLALSTPRHISPQAWVQALATCVVASIVAKIARKVPHNNN